MDRMTYVKHPHSWNRGKYPTKYTSRHTFQEAVARLAAYEDTGLEPQEIVVLIAPPNPPLTVEDLRKMNGEPVWVERHSHFDCTPHWALVHVHRSGDVYLTERNCGQILFIIGDKVYRRKPEEGTVSKMEVEQHEKV